MRIVIGNLPPGATEEGLRRSLSAIAAVGEVTLVPGTGDEGPLAVIRLGVSREQADRLVARIHGYIHEGRRLEAWVPLRDPP